MSSAPTRVLYDEELTLQAYASVEALPRDFICELSLFLRIATCSSSDSRQRRAQNFPQLILWACSADVTRTISKVTLERCTLIGYATESQNFPPIFGLPICNSCRHAAVQQHPVSRKQHLQTAMHPAERAQKSRIRVMTTRSIRLRTLEQKPLGLCPLQSLCLASPAREDRKSCQPGPDFRQVYTDRLKAVVLPIGRQNSPGTLRVRYSSCHKTMSTVRFILYNYLPHSCLTPFRDVIILNSRVLILNCRHFLRLQRQLVIEALVELHH